MQIPGVVWTTLATFIPLAVMFVNGLAEQDVITGAVASVIVIVLGAILKIIEVYGGKGAPAGVLGNVAPADTRSRARRFWLG